MISLGNHQYGKNVRILLINNGLGVEFKFEHNRAYNLGDSANAYIAAQGHNGAKSRELVKHYAQDLGFMYLSAETKKEYIDNLNIFLDSDQRQSIIYEVFIDYNDDVKACTELRYLYSSLDRKLINKAKSIVGESGIKKVKKLLGKDSVV